MRVLPVMAVVPSVVLATLLVTPTTFSLFPSMNPNACRTWLSSVQVVIPSISRR